MAKFGASSSIKLPDSGRPRLNDDTARQCFYRNQRLKRVGIVLTADDDDHGRRIAARLRSATCA